MKKREFFDFIEKYKDFLWYYYFHVFDHGSYKKIELDELKTLIANKSCTFHFYPNPAEDSIEIMINTPKNLEWIRVYKKDMDIVDRKVKIKKIVI